jgi:hypothetical protein
MTYDSKTRTITLGSNSNETDTLVDLGSHFVHNLRYFAAQPNVPNRILSDWRTIETWLGCAGRELNQADNAKIGEAFRSYFAKGVPPSVELGTAFQYFSKRVKHRNVAVVPVPPQVEAVFNRMLATDGEILARKALEPKPAPAPIGKVTHYANSKRMCCCSIKLVSGERVFISIAAAPTPSVKIMKMGLLGIFPVQTIWEYNPTMAGGYDAYLRKMMLMFQDPLATEPKHPLDILRDRLLPCKSISEVRDSLLNAERSASGW